MKSYLKLCIAKFGREKSKKLQLQRRGRESERRRKEGEIECKRDGKKLSKVRNNASRIVQIIY